jgi:LysM repeat protein
MNSRTTGPEPMSLADYGDWGVQVPEATQLAWLATEAVAQGNATMPIVSTATPTRTPRPNPTSTPKATQASTSTSSAKQPTASPAPTETSAPPTATPLPTATSQPFTPIPPAPIMGRHVVSKDETLFCIARAYGVLPAAIAQANGLFPPFTVLPGQTLNVPAVQWKNIAPGQVCSPQFTSLYPGLSHNTPTPTAIGSLTVVLNVKCIANCDTLAADYVLHVQPVVTGGAAPYTYDPGIGLDVQFNSQPFGHCSDVHGLVTVTSADGQTASAPWYYHDVACPTPTVSP